jgi:hypothetical protein
MVRDLGRDTVVHKAIHALSVGPLQAGLLLSAIENGDFNSYYPRRRPKYGFLT